jgi:nitrate reductase molybdenum cofactor assembly chaperone NarJ/NarW
MRLYRVFSDIVDYPRPNLLRSVNECIALLPSVERKGVRLMKGFRQFVKRTPLPEMEEVYSHTFDLQLTPYPSVAQYLIPDEEGRGLFLAGLKEHYQSYDFAGGNDAPDHLSVMLRFLSHYKNGEAEELISECIVPALKKMMAGIHDRQSPYRAVLEALLILFEET